jgi:hypothetical protein
MLKFSSTKNLIKKKFVKKNITSSKILYLLKMKTTKLINYLINMCEGKLFMTNEMAEFGGVNLCS